MKDVGKAIRQGLVKRRLISQQVKDHQPGAAVLVVAGGRVVYKKTVGLANVEKKVPVTGQTTFDLASVSKQFTAMAVLILVERGQLSLDDDVRLYLPEVPTFSKKRPIKLTDLLHHTSGLPDYIHVWRGVKRETRLTNKRYLEMLIKHRLDFPTGRRAEYSNSNYILLALVIERVTGKPFRHFMAGEIFRPLKMRHSYIHDHHNIHIPHRARGYNVTKAGKVKPCDIPIILVGHSHQFSTIADLARWEKALRTELLVGKETLAQMFRAGRLDNGKKHEYGFGWYEERKNGRRVFGHSGDWYGFSSYIGRYLKDRLTVAVLSNNESLDVEQLAGDLARVYLRGGNNRS
jgi:CubicO group peptidase (beta-lactamase class C family)